MVLLIMVLHGLPVFLLGVWSDSKNALNIAAVISAIIGFITGSPTWILTDLFAIWLAYVAASSFITTDNDALENMPIRQGSNSSLESEFKLRRQQELENKEMANLKGAINQDIKQNISQTQRQIDDFWFRKLLAGIVSFILGVLITAAIFFGVAKSGAIPPDLMIIPTGIAVFLPIYLMYRLPPFSWVNSKISELELEKKELSEKLTDEEPSNLAGCLVVIAVVIIIMLVAGS